MWRHVASQCLNEIIYLWKFCQISHANLIWKTLLCMGFYVNICYRANKKCHVLHTFIDIILQIDIWTLLHNSLKTPLHDFRLERAVRLSMPNGVSLSPLLWSDIKKNHLDNNDPREIPMMIDNQRVNMQIQFRYSHMNTIIDGTTKSEPMSVSVRRFLKQILVW